MSLFASGFIPSLLEADSLPPLVITADRIFSEADALDHYTQDRIQQSQPRTIDEVLSRSPSFSLFRRQSSLFANPTTTGVSLRQTGATAASRSLVLLDGIPQNDPFGGWVNWVRYHPALLDSVSLESAATSSINGNLGTSGSVHLRTRSIDARRTTLAVTGGSHGLLSGFASHEFTTPDGKVGLRFSAHSLDTSGFEALPRSQRGVVDRRLSLESRGSSLEGHWQINRAIRLESRLSGFEEERGNGTALSGNSTRALDFSLRLTSSEGPLRWQAQTWHQDRDYESRFTAVTPERDSERVALDQFDVPGRGTGGAWRFEWDASETSILLGGVDFRALSGETNEQAGAFRQRQAGGDQRTVGAYLGLQYDFHPSWTFSGSLRLDHWRLNKGRRLETRPTDGSILRDDRPPDRDDWEPAVTLRLDHSLTDEASIFFAASTSFRLPTLNELHRPFRIRTETTEANPDLDPERFYSLESGWSWTGETHDVSLTAFHHWIDDPVVNAPIGPDLRQRQNLGQARVYGIEAQTSWDFDPQWSLQTGAKWSRSHLDQGLRFPQAPELVGLVDLEFRPNDSLSLTAGASWTDTAFDGSRGERSLPSFWNTSLTINWQARPNLALRARAENLLDETIITGRSSNGLTTLGQPRAFWLSAEWQF